MKHIPIFDVTIGSTVYGTNTPQSDIDNKAIHIADKFDFYTNNFEKQINFNKDSVSYELSRFLELIKVNNPTCLEMLFTPEKHIRTMHPMFKTLIDNKEKFLTKMCKDTFGGYVRSQIMKATALDKKMNWEKERVERKNVLDFCMTFYKQGSTKIEHWLEHRGLHQKYCGLVNISNMHDVYGLFYDLGAHMRDLDTLPNDKGLELILGCFPDISYYCENVTEFIIEFYNEYTHPIGYKGIVGEDSDSNQVRLSSIPKGAKPICHMSWNKTGYTAHCKDYNAYQKWLSERNTQRYVDTNTHGQMIDGKNLLHCRRLLDMAFEIAEQGTIILERPNAKELLKIRKGEVNLDSIISKANDDLSRLNEVYDNSSLPNTIDVNLLDEIHYKIRKNFY